MFFFSGWEKQILWLIHATVVFSTLSICSKLFFYYYVSKAKTAFSTAAGTEELRQHVVLLPGYRSVNTTAAVSSSLPETLIGLAATNPIGHWRLVKWIHTEPASPHTALYLSLSKTAEEDPWNDSAAVSLLKCGGGGGGRNTVQWWGETVIRKAAFINTTDVQLLFPSGISVLSSRETRQFDLFCFLS